MSHVTSPPTENDETFHEIPRAAPLSETTNGAFSRVETAPAAPPVLANSDATFGVSGVMSQSEASANAMVAQKPSADFFTAPTNGASARDVSANEIAAEGATLNGDGALSRNAPLDFSIVETPPRVLASSENDDATLVPRAQSNDAREDEVPSLLEIGARIGPYEVQAHCGDGGMASVYRVWHTGLHRVEALKVPRQQGRFGPEAAFLRRLLAEARTVANLQHPNIAAIYAISDAASPLQFFSMEFVEGGDLATFLKQNGQLTPSVALPILEQVAAALDYAHSQNVIHRDIKPANVLLQQNGENTVAKVVDFGISRANEEAGATRLTRSGMIVGTPEYMSPEQSGSGDDVTARTDEYSLGVLAYEMLCGAPPFVAGEGVSRLSLLMKHVGEAPQTPAHHVSGLPVAASDAIIRALSKKPEERFASCREFVAALREGLAGHDGIAAAPETLSAAAPRPTRAFSPAEKTMEIVPVEAVKRARLTALLAGVGGLVAGVALVFGWLGYGNFPVKPMSLPAPIKAPASTAKTPREYSQVLPRVVMQREVVPFKTVTRETASLKKGVKRLVQKGRAGTHEVKLEISVKNGVQDVRRGAAKTLVAPRAEIVEIGTAEKSAPPKSSPAKAASTRETLERAKSVVAPSKRVKSKRVVRTSAEAAIPAKKRAAPRNAKPKRAIKMEKRRVAKPLYRRKSAKRSASTRKIRRAAPRPNRRAFGGAEAGLPP